MTHTIPALNFRPHVLTVLESRRAFLRRCAYRALQVNKDIAAVKWHEEAQEVEEMIDLLQRVMKIGAPA